MENIKNLTNTYDLKWNNKRCINSFEIITKVETLRLAYLTIKSNPGNMVKGSDKKTLDGINEKWFTETSRKLIYEKYEFKPARRVYIPKTNGKFRPLSISSPRDKIIQQAIKMTLERILEPKFLNSSHGFRPKKGCHSALKEIRRWKGVSWMIEGDIEKFFDNVDHKLLITLLEQHIEDKRMINLIGKLIKAGYVEWDTTKRKYVNAIVGVPQGGIASPLLSNLILHELDKFIQNLIIETNKEHEGKKPYTTNPKYHAISMKIHRLKKKINENDIKNSNMIEEYKQLNKFRRRLKSTIPNPLYQKIRYVRYADDWLMGLWGTRKQAIKYREMIRIFLESLKLKLSMEKTRITNTRSNWTKFLGVTIKRITNNIGPTKMMRNLKRRIPGGNLWMTAPILEIFDKLQEKGFVKKSENKWTPKSIGNFVPLNIKDIIMRFNLITRGISNYYSFADNRTKLSKIVWILKESLRKTLSRKLKLNKMQFTKKFGREINIWEKNQGKSQRVISYANPDLTRKPMQFFVSQSFNNPLEIKDWKISTKYPFDRPCANCGAKENIEVHHIKHIRTINLKLNEFDKMIARINRKQVPLCKTCHMEVHRGLYKGKSLKHLSKVK